jgi:hypothetical protein
MTETNRKPRTLRDVDWKWTVTAVLPVLTLILGAWLNQLNDRHRENAQLRREERLHALERERQKRDKREEFELTNLTGLLTALTDLSAAAVRIREAPPAFGSEEMVQWGVLNGQVNSRSGLVLDDTLRQQVDRLHHEITTLMLSAHAQVDARPRNEQMLALGQSQLAVNAALTARIRAIYLERG